MTKSDKATALPWHRGEDGFIYGANSETVADFDCSATDIDEREACKDLCLRAVNSHAALVEALADATALLEHYISGHPNNWDGSTKGQTVATIREARAALTLAKGA